jgi:hypothetical protein
MRAGPSFVPSWLAVLALGVLLAACGPKNLKDRTKHGDKLADDASTLLDEAEQDLNKLDAEGAQGNLKEAQKLLTHPDIELSPEGEMLQSRYSELQARLAPTRDEKARRELEAAADKQRESLMQAMEEVSNALEGIERKDATPAHVEAVVKAVERTRERLKEGKKLEAKSEDYGASARRAEQRLEQATAKAKSVQQVLEFVAGPATTRQQGEGLMKQAKAEKDPDKQLTIYKDALDHFTRCGDTAKQLIAKSPEIEKGAITVEGQPTTPKAVASGCGSRTDALTKTVAKLEQAKVARDKKKSAAAAKSKGKPKKG